MDKLTIEYIEDIIPTMAHTPFEQRIAKQLADTMRENERLRKQNDRLMGIDRNDAKWAYENINQFEQPPVSEKELSYKDSEDA